MDYTSVDSGEDADARVDRCWVVEAEREVQRRDLLQLPIIKIKVGRVQILQQTRLVCRLRNNGDSARVAMSNVRGAGKRVRHGIHAPALRRPSEKHLSRSLLVRDGNCRNVFAAKEV